MLGAAMPPMQFVKRAKSDQAIGRMASAKLRTPSFCPRARGPTVGVFLWMTAAIEHTDVSTGLSHAELVEAFERVLGRWNPATAERLVQRKAGWDEVETEAARAGGTRGLIIHSLNQGAVTSLSGQTKDCRLYLVGNPVIASRILDIDPPRCLLRSVPRLPLQRRRSGWCRNLLRPTQLFSCRPRPCRAG